jgi:hypothetical protein
MISFIKKKERRKSFFSMLQPFYPFILFPDALLG